MNASKVTMKRNWLCMAMCISAVMFTGCASVSHVSVLEYQDYYGKWFKIDFAQTNVPSGAHLYGVLCKKYECVQMLQNNFGVPGYVKQNDEFISEFIFQGTNCLVSVDWRHGKPEAKALHTLSDAELPAELVSLRQKEAETIRQQVETESRVNYKIVEVVGIGSTQDEAQKNALYLAVEQVVGAIVDAKSQVENDRIVKDQILTMSAGYVQDYQVIVPPAQKDGKYEIKIRAKVKRTKLLCDLEDKDVAIRKEVKGEALWAQAVTQGRVKEQADKILSELFAHDPRRLCVEQLSETELIPPSELTEELLKISDQWLRIKIKIYVDCEEYNDSFLPKLLSCLDSISSCVAGSVPFGQKLWSGYESVRKYKYLEVREKMWGYENGDAMRWNNRIDGIGETTCNTFVFDRELVTSVRGDDANYSILTVFKAPSAKSGEGVNQSPTQLWYYRLPPFYANVIKKMCSYESKRRARVRKDIAIEFLDSSQTSVAMHRIRLFLTPVLIEEDGDLVVHNTLHFGGFHNRMLLNNSLYLQQVVNLDADIIKKVRSTRITVIDNPPITRHERQYPYDRL
jgi:hypothetical protein